MIDIVFERDVELFRDGNKALDFARSIPATDPKWIDSYNIHFRWRSLSPFGRKQSLAIRAAIATQPLDLCHIILWSNVDLSDNEYVKPMLPYMELRIYDAVKEKKDTPIENLPIEDAFDSRCWLDSDIFRLLIPYKYGGVYCDQDMVLLRDLTPLLSQEFLYQWGNEPDRINGAILHLDKKSLTATQLVSEIASRPWTKNSTSLSLNLYTKVRQYNKSFTVFPCAFFDTEWHLSIDMEREGNPFNRVSHSVPDFDGAFAWHWHNAWDAAIQTNCKWERIEARIQSLYDTKVRRK